jgi:glucose/arabinose dehydrogenase
MHRIVRYDDIERRLDNPPAPVVVRDGFMESGNHQWRYIAFGPDGKLYIAVGAPCNVCTTEDPYGTIARMNPDGSGFEIYAHGVRNSVGLTFHPDNGQLWFTDNGRDLMGDNIPSDELNHATEGGQHFGFPACHQGDVVDPEFGRPGACGEYRPPAVKLGPHVAALGLRFYTGEMFPEEYKGSCSSRSMGRGTAAIRSATGSAWCTSTKVRVPRVSGSSPKGGCRGVRRGAGRWICSSSRTGRCSYPTICRDTSTGSRTASSPDCGRPAAA